MRAVGTLLLFSATLFADPNLLPLQEGNFWTYVQRGGQDSFFSIQVGATSTIGGNVYYRLTGYTTDPLWVRFGDHDALYYRDEVKNVDVLLTSFEQSTKGPFPAPLRVCPSSGQVQQQNGRYSGPAGSLLSTLVIQYTVSSCADVGVQEEHYAENIGMVERIQNSFTGPRVYDLVAAKVGTIQSVPYTNFGLGILVPGYVSGSPPDNQPPALLSPRADGRIVLDYSHGVTGILGLRIAGPDPVTIHYVSSQEFDAIVRNEQGTVVWQWSEGRVFLPVVLDEITHGRARAFQLPLTDRQGVSLPAGKYSLEAWIVSGQDRPQFSATAPFRIPEKA